MKLKAIIAGLLITVAPLVIVTPMAVTSGCTTSQKTVAYKTLKSVQDASVTGLEVYRAAYNRGEIDTDTRARVLDAYTKYQRTFSVAITAAQMDYSAPTPPEVAAALTELLNLVAVFQK